MSDVVKAGEDEVLYNAKTGKWEVWLLADPKADPPIERKLLKVKSTEAAARLWRDNRLGMRRPEGALRY